MPVRLNQGGTSRPVLPGGPTIDQGANRRIAASGLSGAALQANIDDENRRQIEEFGIANFNNPAFWRNYYSSAPGPGAPDQGGNFSYTPGPGVNIYRMQHGEAPLTNIPTAPAPNPAPTPGSGWGPIQPAPAPTPPSAPTSPNNNPAPRIPGGGVAFQLRNGGWAQPLLSHTSPNTPVAGPTINTFGAAPSPFHPTAPSAPAPSAPVASAPTTNPFSFSGGFGIPNFGSPQSTPTMANPFQPVQPQAQSGQSQTGLPQAAPRSAFYNEISAFQ